MKPPVLIIGGGGHAKVLIEVLRLTKTKILGILDNNTDLRGQFVLDCPVIGNDDYLEKVKLNEFSLVNGVGSVGLPNLRKNIFEKFKRKGFRFSSVVHPSAIIASDVEVGEGAQIMAGCVVQPGCKIGYNSILNTKVSIDHDCTIGSNVHLAPGVTFSGSVVIGNSSHVGTGANVIQSVTIGREVVIGAGALVLKDVPDAAVVFGVPGRISNKK